MIKYKMFLTWSLMGSVFMGSAANAALTTQELVQALQTNPESVMDLVPEKQYPEGQTPRAFFTKEQIESGEYVQIRHQAKGAGRDHMKVIVIDPVTHHKKIMKIGQNLPGRAPIAANDNPASLVDRGSSLITSVAEMEARGLRQARLSESPWSDYYWPIRSGLLGMRYGDRNFPTGRGTSWHSFKNYIDTHPVSSYVGEDLRYVSPSEKYDILVGGRHGAQNLTRNMWAQGQSFASTGDVEWWMGICHGWAPAAYMMPRPAQSVRVNAVDGTPLVFFPSDLKALGTLLWAEQSPATRFIGGRCNAKEATLYRDNGRIADQDCFDTNPGAWHQAVVNQIGVSRRSFVMDATFDYEVWNQPVYSYSYEYFNVQTGAVYTNIIQNGRFNMNAVVERARFTNDPFRKYRTAHATYLIGVKMNVGYVVETQPNQMDVDSPARDAITQVQYHYDLEVDGNGNILGGEWYTNRHPDFLWTPAPGASALSPYDNVSGSWLVGGQSLPQTWAASAQRAAAAGHPLNTILQALYTAARR